ncbi:CGNR zinc finger domain-containing protein [Taklimakanibacter deserti]|uniref:CGNR zinc finger domain-containing protein n=1 Tax=Taklimakanibacter deserti TaxID=2267839 RepID=UPI000E657B52
MFRMTAMLISTVSEDLCLDYTHTVSWRGGDAPIERLEDIDDLLQWIEHNAGVEREVLRRIGRWTRDNPEYAQALLDEAVTTRETIYRILSAIAEGKPVPDKDFARLTRAIAETPPRNALVRSDGRFGWRIAELRPVVAHLLAPVLWSAGDLILAADRRRIRRCANEECLWLFLDESKSGTRRWCDMASCGNRAKARRHYSKTKQS